MITRVLEEYRKSWLIARRENIERSCSKLVDTRGHRTSADIMVDRRRACCRYHIVDEMMDRLRKEADKCSNLAGFFVGVRPDRDSADLESSDVPFLRWRDRFGHWL